MPVPLPAELADLLARLQAAGDGPLFLGRDDVDAWPAGMVEALHAQGVVERAAPAAGIVCPGCEEACNMTVNVRPRDAADAVAFIVCDKRRDMGRVPVPLRLLERWQVTPRTLARALARSQGHDDATPLAQGWRLGWAYGTTGRVAVTLQQHSIGVAGHVLDLGAALTWDGKRLGLHGRTMARLSATPVGDTPPESADGRAERLLRRKVELKNAGVRAFLKQIASEEGGLSTSRVKQIIQRAESRPSAGGSAHPFAGLGAREGGTTPVRPAAKRKR